jgi:hypothetical protein
MWMVKRHSFRVGATLQRIGDQNGPFLISELQ